MEMRHTILCMHDDKRENFFIEMLKFAFIALVVVLPIRLFIAQPFVVSGSSMEPTFENGEYLIVDQVTYALREPERLEVVIFHYPKDPSKYFIKRIIGLPGETVIVGPDGVQVETATGGTLALGEAYVVNRGNGNFGRYTLKDGEYFVMGDNRPASSDSRVWGGLPKEDIVGRAFVRLLPPRAIEFLPGSVRANGNE